MNRSNLLTLLKKHLRRSSIPISLLLLTVSCGTQITDKRTMAIPLEYVNGSFIVELAENDKSKEENLKSYTEKIKLIAEKINCSAKDPEPMQWASSSAKSEVLSSTYHQTLEDCKITEEDLSKFLEEAQTIEEVRMIEANAVAKTTVSESDPYKSNQYYLDYTNRDKACESAGKVNQKEVVVAVIDSGVDKDHGDLVSNFYKDRNGRVIGANFVGKGARYAPDSNWDDKNGHGTHVAGIVAASANNSKGITGVASCRNVKIMPVKALGDNGSGNTVEIDRAIQWAAENGADIINLSLGSNQVARYKSQPQRKSLYEYLARKNIIVFAAAGNESLVHGSQYGSGYIYSYPASYEKVIAVASTNTQGDLSDFSNRGDKVDIAAPGSSILSTIPGGSFKRKSGTSMAAPVAAGIYALAYSMVVDDISGGLNHDNALKMMSDAKSSNQRLDSSMVASGAVLDGLALTNIFKTKYEKKEDETDLPELEDSDPEEIDQKPDEVADPVEEDPAEAVMEGMRFVGLKSGSALDGAIRISVKDWPEKTFRIFLYWGNEGDDIESFTSLSRAGLSDDGSTVSSVDRFNLYGNKRLYAEAVNFWGERIKLISVPLKGL